MKLTNVTDDRSIYEKSKNIISNLTNAYATNNTSDIATWTKEKENIKADALKDYNNIINDPHRYNKEMKEFYELHFGFGKKAIEYNIEGQQAALDANQRKLDEIGFTMENEPQEVADKTAERKSPSKWWHRAAVYDVLGYEEGFEEESIPMLRNVANIFGMAQDMMDDEAIQPTITPIYDDSNLFTSGLTSLNKSYSGINKATDATVNSFVDDTVNYNGTLAALSNQVAMLTGVVNGFMRMVAEGDIVTVNVNAEADTNNLYNFVVDTNRQKFRQTGKNLLMT